MRNNAVTYIIFNKTTIAKIFTSMSLKCNIS